MITPAVGVYQNVVSFIKMTPLRDRPNQDRWARDEYDLLEALEVTREYTKDTARMIGKPMYSGEKAFDFAEDIRRAVEEMYLSSRERSDVLLQRKRHLVMYHLVLEAVIDDLAQYDHQLVVSGVEGYIEQLLTFIQTSDMDVHIDDAVVAQELTRIRVRQREAQRKEAITRRKTTTKKSKIRTEDDE